MKSKQRITKGFKAASITAFAALVIWQLVSPISILFKIAWINLMVYAGMSILLNEKTDRWIKWGLRIWGIASILLLTYWALVETGHI
jgi:hypothetical protein